MSVRTDGLMDRFRREKINRPDEKDILIANLQETIRDQQGRIQQLKSELAKNNPRSQATGVYWLGHYIQRSVLGYLQDLHRDQANGRDIRPRLKYLKADMTKKMEFYEQMTGMQEITEMGGHAMTLLRLICRDFADSCEGIYSDVGLDVEHIVYLLGYRDEQVLSDTMNSLFPKVNVTIGRAKALLEEIGQATPVDSQTSNAVSLLYIYVGQINTIDYYWPDLDEFRRVALSPGGVADNLRDFNTLLKRQGALRVDPIAFDLNEVVQRVVQQAPDRVVEQPLDRESILGVVSEFNEAIQNDDKISDGGRETGIRLLFHVLQFLRLDYFVTPGLESFRYQWLREPKKVFKDVAKRVHTDKVGNVDDEMKTIALNLAKLLKGDSPRKTGLRAMLSGHHRSL